MSLVDVMMGISRHVNDDDFENGKEVEKFQKAF